MSIPGPSPTTTHAEPSAPSARGRGRWTWRTRALAAGASIVAACVLVEAAVRIFSLGPAVYAPRRYEPRGVPFVGTKIDSMVVPAYRPNSVFASVYDPAGDKRGYFGPQGRVVYRINELGMRGGPVEIDKPPETYRVICLGDSFTFGEGVFEEHTYPQLLERELSKALPRLSVQVLNAAVQGYGTREEAAVFFARWEKLRPDLVIVGFFLNDTCDLAETIRINDEMTRAFEPTGLSRISRAWEIVQRRQAAARMQDESFAMIRASLSPQRWQAALDLLRAVQGNGKDNHYRTLVVVFPVLWALDGWYPFQAEHDRIDGDLRAAGTEVVDLLDVYRGRPAASLWVHPTDHHPNEIAHRMAAEAILEQIARKKS